jgi:hypothetical protein
LPKLIFPEFAPEIDIGDDRLATIAERIRRIILNPNGIKPENLEFEAKLGSI